MDPQPSPNERSKIIIYIVSSVSFILCSIIISVGLGVGLGLGLRRRSNNDNHILAPLNVKCQYINSSSCGCSATKPIFTSSRIVNGHTTNAHSWPWTVALYLHNSILCHGFLVTDEHVITAAHCIPTSSPLSLQVYIGMHLRSSLDHIQIRNVSQIRKHPDFIRTTLLNDIPILKLTSKIIPTNTVGRCCLPTAAFLPTIGESAVVVGWGRTRTDDNNSISDSLQQTIVQIQQCPTNENSNTQFCAAYKDHDACQGDSGGPLMTNVNNRWTCTGIISYGLSCGNGGFYTRVAHYRTFIDNAINSM